MRVNLLLNEIQNTMLSEQFQSKFHRLIIEIGKINIPYTHISDRSITWLSTGTLMKGGGAKLVLWTRSIAHLYQLIHTPNHT